MVLFCVLWLSLASSAFAATKAIRAGKVVDGSGRVITNAVIVVDNDRITSVGTGAPPAGVEVIDLSRFTLIPGLIDLHTHMTYFWDRAPGTRPLNQPRRPAGVTTVLAAENARRTLETGVTTVRDLGASGDVDYAMRDLINMGQMVGPRMFVAGQGLSAPRADAPKPDYRQLAEARIAAGSDWVKVSGRAALSERGHDERPYETMKAAWTPRAGHRVAIHSYGPSGVRDATRRRRFGQHGLTRRDDTIADMVTGDRLVPTIDHNRYYVTREMVQLRADTIPPLKASSRKTSNPRAAFTA
jgi:imidazolonepropionase-like amidohydrolase